MQIKVPYNYNTFTSLEFINVTINIMTYISVVNLPTHCATLLYSNFGKETFHKIILDFIISINNTSLHEGVQYHPNYLWAWIK